ncbi:amidohydrolase [Microbulbifer agarilyticus]|uniref:amidohydrolase n=1 Tax=Microbulbifer agarilyticus TaxID=260552 RepID=UPI001C948B5C|nr:amidohydrolase [Microbulbifer agarilyticus]MBY6212333.1 amidohydrolase [Microbulbifer agarilyticus]
MNLASRSQFNMKQPALGLLLVIFALVVNAQPMPSPTHPEWTDLLKDAKNPIAVYTAKRVRTMDPGRPEATAIAVVGGKVLSTGTLESMQPWLSRYPHKIDHSLKDKVILPGFIEPHAHPWMSAGFLALNYIGPIAAPNPAGGVYEPARTSEEVMERLRTLHKSEANPNKPLVAYGFDPAQQGGKLDRDTLDKISSTRPIWVIAFAPHFAYLNSAALEILEKNGLGPDTNIHGVQKNPDGSLSGVFIEVLAVTPAIQPVFDQILAGGGVNGLKFMGRVARSVGVTTMSELTFGAIDFDKEWNDYHTAANDPDHALRMRLVPMESALRRKFGNNLIAAHQQLREKNDDKLFVDGIKFLTDGSFPLMSSMVGFPGYLDGGNGHVNDVPWDKLVERMIPFWDAGIQIHCHANGDLATDASLAALEGLQAHKPRFDHRFTIEHYSMSTPMQARRLKVLGGLASVNAYFTYFRSQLHSDHAYGPDRSQSVARLGSLVREGVIFGLHSDYPQVIVPMNPMLAVWTAVNRLAEDGKTVMAPGERISVERALRAVTIDAAYVLGMEDKVGSLEPGKLADFAILDADPFEVAPRKLKDIKVWGTALSGEIFQNTQE